MKKKTKRQKDFLDVVWDQATLGNMISSLRQCDGISQTDLAERIGVSKQFLSNVENNRKNIGVKFLKKISIELGYPIEPFLELLIREQLEKEGLNYSVSITA